MKQINHFCFFSYQQNYIAKVPQAPPNHKTRHPQEFLNCILHACCLHPHKLKPCTDTNNNITSKQTHGLWTLYLHHITNNTH